MQVMTMSDDGISLLLELRIIPSPQALYK